MPNRHVLTLTIGYRVDILDPESDQRHLSPRFCHGAYIWQVRNADGQALLSGPEYPSPNPLAFNGQGLPEVFRFDEKWEGLPPPA